MALWKGHLDLHDNQVNWFPFLNHDLINLASSKLAFIAWWPIEKNYPPNQITEQLIIQIKCLDMICPQSEMLIYNQINCDVYSSIIDQFHKSQNAIVPYPTMLHSEQKCAHFCSEWSIMAYGTGAFWDLWIRSIVHCLPSCYIAAGWHCCIFYHDMQISWHKPGSPPIRLPDS